jgi:hypothetical protein
LFLRHPAGHLLPTLDCEDKGARTECAASVSRPAGNECVFEDRGAKVRLVEIGTGAEDS